MDGSGTFWYNGDRETKEDAPMKRLPLILLSLTTLATVVFCLLWQGARRDHSDLVTLARSGAAETCTRFSDDQSHGDDGDYWGGVAAFHTFRQACALLPEQGSDAVCSAVYGQLLLYPDRAKAHLPELIAVMEPLAQDPTDASARLRLYGLRDLLQEDA
jgi:hypothetical protein